MKNRSRGFYIKLAIFIFLLIFSFRYNALIGNALISVFVLVQLYMSRPFIYSILGNNNYAKGNKTVALNWYKKAAEVGSCKPRTKTAYGYLLLKEGQVEEADKELSKVFKCKLDTKDLNQLKLTYALVKWKQDNLDEAMAMVEDVHNNYRCTTAYESLGYMLILKGDLQRALEFNMEAYDYNNGNDVIVDNLGETYYYLKDFDKANELYEKLIAKNPTFAEPYYYYGLLKAEKGKKEEALELLEKALTFKESFLSNLTKAKINASIEAVKGPE